MVIDPPVSVPSAEGTTPSATLTALPPLDPPEERSGRTGLRTSPNVLFVLVMPSASSCMFVLPTTTAPAARRRLTAPASVCAVPSRRNGVPAVVGRPATSMLSSTEKGMPPSRPAACSPRSGPAVVM